MAFEAPVTATMPINARSCDEIGRLFTGVTSAAGLVSGTPRQTTASATSAGSA